MIPSGHGHRVLIKALVRLVRNLTQVRFLSCGPRPSWVSRAMNQLPGQLVSKLFLVLVPGYWRSGAPEDDNEWPNYAIVLTAFCFPQFTPRTLPTASAVRGPEESVGTGVHNGRARFVHPLGRYLWNIDVIRDPVTIWRIGNHPQRGYFSLCYRSGDLVT